MSRTIEKLFRAPYGVPNGLQVTDEGLWIVDQITDQNDLSVIGDRVQELQARRELESGQVSRYEKFADV